MRIPLGGLAETSLGARFLLIVFAAAVVPLCLVGIWLVRDADRAGQELLEERMRESLSELATDLASDWVGTRSSLLDWAESPEVLALVRGEEEVSSALPSDLQEPAEGVGSAQTVAVRDQDGRTVARFPSNGSGWDSGLPVEIPVHDPRGGARLGTLEARLSVDGLLGRAPEWTAGTGGVAGILGPDGESAVVSAPFDSDLLRRSSFQLGAEEWIAVQRRLSEPEAVLVLAAPVEPFRLPFQEAARRGILLLIGVAAAGFAVAAILVRQTTRPVRELAEASRALSDGGLDRRVAVRGPRELRQSARAFNTMADNLQRTLDALSKREALAAVGEFAGGLAHELRNPLTAIRLDLQRMEEVADDDARRSALVNRLLSAVGKLDRTVGGVLRVAGTGRLRLERLRLSEPLESAMETAHPAVARRSGVLVAPSEDACVHGDRDALEQLFANLLLNAAEALEGPGDLPRVDVAVERADDRQGKRGVEVRIRDTGRGIPPDTLEHVFEPLVSTKPGGTGLGLVIAHRIAQAHNGEIRVESQEGQGTTVTVWLPAPPEDEAERARPAE